MVFSIIAEAAVLNQTDYQPKFAQFYDLLTENVLFTNEVVNQLKKNVGDRRVDISIDSRVFSDKINALYNEIKHSKDKFIAPDGSNWCFHQRSGGSIKVSVLFTPPQPEKSVVVVEEDSTEGDEIIEEASVEEESATFSQKAEFC